MEAITAPFLVPLSHPMSTVNDAYNAAWIKCKATDNVMLYGSGAGKYPTASAVISNIVDAITACNVPFEWSAEKMPILSTNTYSKVIRVSCDNHDAFLKAINAEKAVTLANYPSFAAWLTPPETEEQTAASLEKLKEIPGFRMVEQVLRVFGEK